MTPGSATSHYNSKRHKRNIVVCRDEIVKNLKSEQQEAVEVKRKEELNPDINNGEMLEKNNISQNEPVIQILEERGIQPGIGNGKMLKKINTNQKEPVIDILELNNLKSEQDLEVIVKEKIENLTLPDYCYICKANLMSLCSATSHYNSDKHNINIAVYRNEILNNLKSEQQVYVDLETIVKEKIANLTLPDYCHVCKANLMSPDRATTHYNSKRHRRNIAAKDEILKILKSEQQEAVEDKGYCCLICKIEVNSKELYEAHVQTCIHKLYSSVETNNKSHKTIVSIKNNECNIGKGKNETAACYNTNERELVIDDLEKQEINPVINNEEMCEKINTNQKEPSIDDIFAEAWIKPVTKNGEILEKFYSNQKEPVIEILEQVGIKPGIDNVEMLKKNNTNYQTEPAQLYSSVVKNNNGHEIIVNINSNDSDISKGENETTDYYNTNGKEPVIDDLETQEINPVINTEEMWEKNNTNQKEPVIDILELNNLKSEQQDLEAIVKKKIENLTLPHYCHICETKLMTPDRATSHYESRRHELHIAAHRNKIFYNLKSEQQEAVEGKSYCCLVCDIELNSKELYETHIESCLHESYASLVKSNNGHGSIVNINSNDCNISKGENVTAACYNTNENEPVIDDLEKQEINPGINNGEILEKNTTNQKESVKDILEEVKNKSDINNGEMLVNNNTNYHKEPSQKLYSPLVKNNNGHEIIDYNNSNDCNIGKGENKTASCYNTDQKEPVIDDLEKNEMEIVVNNEEMLNPKIKQIIDRFIEISHIENSIINEHKNEIMTLLKQKFIDCEKTECYKVQAEVFLLLKQIIDKIYCADSPPLMETLKVLESVHKNLHNPVQIREEQCTQLKHEKISEVKVFKQSLKGRSGYFKVTVVAIVTIGFIWWLIKSSSRT
ncbi:probable serine/threonine-protein kinase DDB_G0283337 [Sitophilus oryzae]|uniref:Probable serine/threonine-protein kinase DDB_G0283337 n=1 Tax=Sitophilus oryzae TaxID=7048 RepID=A0A6J2YR18_SITOR|nr:probable serine/threonine-protein kinase DDB_G0283337 [Sitophilus oryzae]